ncbi:MAG: class I SAM-dependent methyltransferase [Gemmatimonadales bacterium]
MLTSPGLDAPAERGRLVRTVSFVKPYVVGLVGSIALFLGGWATWKGRAIIVELCRHFGYDYITRESPALPRVSVDSVSPDSTRIAIAAVQSVDGNVTDRELVTISRLVVARGAKTIFEFGTFDGRTTLNLAINAGSDARVFTLDLPAESTSSTSAPLHPHETRYAEKPVSGARYRGTEVESAITQLYGDSGTFDFAPYRGSVDFVFVDGSHAYRYVVNDSLRAMEMLKPGGAVVWHDYGRWDDVTRALNDLRRTRPEFAGLAWVEGTTLAVLQR